MIVSGNEGWNRNVFKRWRKVDRRGRCHVVLQAVPDGGSGNWEGPAADGRQFHGRYQQTIGPSRAEGMPTRQIDDMNQLTQVWWRSSMSGLVHDHGRLGQYSFLSPEPMEADECVRDVVWVTQAVDELRSSLTEDARTCRQEDRPRCHFLFCK